MKVELKPTITNQKTTLQSKIRNIFINGRIRIKTLVKDVFEKSAKTKKIETRKEPNWCQTDEDMPNRAVINIPVTFEEFSEDCKKLGLDAKDFILKK